MTIPHRKIAVVGKFLTVFQVKLSYYKFSKYTDPAMKERENYNGWKELGIQWHIIITWFSYTIYPTLKLEKCVLGD